MAEQDTRGIYSVESTAAGLPVTTAQEFPEWQIQRYLGLCFGLVVRSMGAVKGIGAAFKTIKGGVAVTGVG